MVNFEYYAPTHVVFGRDTEERSGELCKAAGAKQVMVVYGGKSAKASGLLGRVEASLKAAGLGCVLFGGIQPNPLLSKAREGITLARSEKVDFVLAVGGGSAIDTAKAIALGAPLAEGEDLWAVYERSLTPKAALPLGAVLTIAAAGSEMSESTVITNDETSIKRGYRGPLARCRFAVMNPALTTTLPAYQTAVGVADILMHTIERYFTPESTMQITDGIAEALLRTVMEQGRILTRQPENYEARAEVMWAGALSHNDLTQAGGGPGDWGVHQLGHELSARFGLAHGASLTSVWSSWARYVMNTDVPRFVRFAEHVMDVDTTDLRTEEAIAAAGIEALEEYFWSLDLPTSLAEADLHPKPAEVEEMAERVTYYGTRTIGALRELGKVDIAAIYTMALGE